MLRSDVGGQNTISIGGNDHLAEGDQGAQASRGDEGTQMTRAPVIR